MPDSEYFSKYFQFFPERSSSEVRERNLTREQIIVLKAIIKYHKEERTSLFSNGVITSYDGCSARFSNYLALVLDLMEKGLYQVPKIEAVQNGHGDIDWNQTFLSTEPIFLKDGPCYVDAVTLETGYDEDTYISRLQMFLATKCFFYFEDIGVAEPLGLFIESPYEDCEENLGSKNYQLMRILNELQIQFIDEKKQTLQLMQAVLNEANNSVDELDVQSFGMSGFHMLWERAIKEVLEDELLKKTFETDLRLLSPDEKRNRTLATYVEAPIWVNEIGSLRDDAIGEGDEVDRLEPDFVATFMDEHDNPCLAILDAKYYLPVFDGKRIRQQPGVGDIDKQLLYQLAYKDLKFESTTKKLNFKNAFVFPKYYALSEDKSQTLRSDLFATIKVPVLNISELDNLPEFKAYMLDGVSLLEKYVFNITDKDRSMLKSIFSERSVPN